MKMTHRQTNRSHYLFTVRQTVASDVALSPTVDKHRNAIQAHDVVETSDVYSTPYRQMPEAETKIVDAMPSL